MKVLLLIARVLSLLGTLGLLFIPVFYLIEEGVQTLPDRLFKVDPGSVLLLSFLVFLVTCPVSIVDQISMFGFARQEDTDDSDLLDEFNEAKQKASKFKHFNTALLLGLALGVTAIVYVAVDKSRLPDQFMVVMVLVGLYVLCNVFVFYGTTKK